MVVITITRCIPSILVQVMFGAGHPVAVQEISNDLPSSLVIMFLDGFKVMFTGTKKAIQYMNQVNLLML